ncbi:MAG: formylglycine-generating enzyme family protein [Opitutales bacterium]
MLTKLGPKPLDEIDYDASEESSADVTALMEESAELEGRFRDVLVLRQPAKEDLEILKTAIDLLDEAQSRSTGFLSGVVEKRQELQRQFDEGMARILNQDLLKHEKAASASREAGDLLEAQRSLRRAYAVQLKINGDYPLSSYVDVGRATRLARDITFIESEPLHLESKGFEASAEEAFREGKWEEARDFLRRAIQTQERLNQEFRNTQRASIVRLAKLRAREVTFRSAQAHGEKVALVEAAEKYAEAKNWAAAANAFDEARRIQRDINTNFPTSGFSSNEEVLRLEVRRQTVLSAELYGRIIRQADELDMVLASRRTAEGEDLVSLINRDLEDLRLRYSRHQHDTESVELKIAYLNVVRERFGLIQDLIYDSLLPLPGKPDISLGRTEISQELYSAVMGSNPSLSFGSKQPVNGVRYDEAEAFCERLSWVLGRVVRLPTREEFRLAVGSLRFVKLEEIAVGLGPDEESKSLSEVASMQPNRAGFYDLLGNVSEWAQRDSENALSDNAWKVGGNAKDPYSKLVQMPADDVSGLEADSFTGFRIVVQ